jgi:class 3 adenylate cyclase
MPNRRESIHEFYRPLTLGETLLTKSAAAANTIPFRGNSIAFAAVVRTDLNGYSKWAREKTAAERAAQLDAFFSVVVPQIDRHGGVFFRDEGDCIVALFSDYFQRGASNDSVERYCMNVTALSFGPQQLTAKTTVACGDVAIFQKRHEIASGDWSAEGEAFVTSARLEAALSSTRQIVMRADEYDRNFANTRNKAAPGARAVWQIVRESVQVQGLGAPGGWIEIVKYEYQS